MWCREVQKLMVPFQDGELAPGDASRVDDHLRRCPDCTRLARQLAQVEPQARLVVPPHIQAQLAARVNGPALREALAAAPPPPRAPLRRLLAWLDRDADVPLGALLVYGVVLAVALAWGLSNWWTVGALEAQLATVPPSRAEAHGAIPAEQYRPAAWSPETADEPLQEDPHKSGLAD